jgi:uncharacterized protein (DUF983 family)
VVNKETLKEWEFAAYLVVLTIAVLLLFVIAIITVGWMITHWQVALITAVMTVLVTFIGGK